MLIPRILTAVVLLAVLIPVVTVGPVWLWGLASLLLLLVAYAEWSRLVSGALPGLSQVIAIAVSGLAIVAILPSGRIPQPLLIAACFPAALFWFLEAPRRLSAHRAGAGRCVLALWLLGACWLALYDLRAAGPAVLVTAMAIVWVADIAAYFAGRAFGRRKLAPSISPGKSWEGAIAGMLAVAILGMVSAKFALLSGALPAVLLGHFGIPAAALILALLAGLSVVGDLFESLLKREAGVKDSGKLLPGHGGALDRIDALIPTMPVVALLHQLLR